MKTMIKMSMKLLLRTKAFWFFLILTPILSTLILKSQFDSSAAYTQKDEGIVIELSGADEKVAYNGGNGEYLVKVYDASKSIFSEKMIKMLAQSGMYMICRCDLSGQGDVFTESFIKMHMKRDGFEDRMGAALYIYPGFGTAGSAEEMFENIKLYAMSDDERTNLLKKDMTFFVNGAAYDGKKFTDALDSVYDNKKVITVSGKAGSTLTAEQVNNKTQIGYAFAFMTLGFVFCGVFVAHATINEQKNGVFTRISLTKAGPVQYFVSKLVTAVVISLMSTGVMGMCSLLLCSDDLGMSRGKYLFMIFLLGLIFSSISMLLGILIGDVMSANVAAFSVWCLSALLSGLYFPLDDVSDHINILASLMPQKWFLNAAEKIITGDNSAYGMVLCITVVYLCVVISTGSLGIKLKRISEWGDS
ncbi:MAG: ABC transporter permease [Lachnospiraceae bacterium]|nr:ABC transporter permease [Lachnospiraceae bacterium]